MIARVCPDCGTHWVSADDLGNWICEKCGKVLEPELNESA